MVKNKLLKLLCINLSVCMLATSMPVTGTVYASSGAAENGIEETEWEAEESGIVKVAEDESSETETGETETEENVTGETEAEEAKNEETDAEGEEPQETNPDQTEESEETDPETTQPEENEGADPETSQPEEEESEEATGEENESEEDRAQETQDTESESQENTEESSEAVKEETLVKKSSEASEDVDEDAAYKEELLEKVKVRYPQMYINEDGMFEYTDASGITHVYDPYDPEFSKYMLTENLVMSESGESDTALVGASNTTVSPFTGKTYTHEDHVADKIIRHGIDVSKYQGNINWTKVKAAGVEFAIVRVGYRGYGAAGNIAGDSYAVQNIKNAYNAGVKVGIYFFSQAITEAEAQEEALYCYNFLKDNGLQQYISLPVFIDYEYSPTGTSGRLYDANLTDAKRQAICDKFVNVIKGYGYEPGIYANYSMLTDDMQPAASSTYSYANYWIARYNSATKYSNEYKFWQYSSQGSVDGITANTVDCNFWYDKKKNINESTINISINDECDYISDVSEALVIYDHARKYTLLEGTDYTVSYSKEIVDDSTVINFEITGIGVYEGTAERSVKVAQATLSAAMVSEIPAQTYTGNEITTETGLPVVISHAGEVLEEGVDYSLSYENNINVGTATVTITGMGNYTGEVQKTFAINRMTIAREMLSEIPDVYYTGAKITSATGALISIVNPNTNEVLAEGTDYTLAYASNINAGTAKVTITGKGNYTGKLTSTFTILKVSVGDGSFIPFENVEITIGGKKEGYTATYTGKSIKPAVTVTVNGVKLKSTDYSVTYKNNVNASEEAYIIVTGKKNYEGTIKKCFTIEPKAPAKVKLTDKMVSLETTCIRADGSSIEPEVYVVQNGAVLTKDTDYAISYTNSKNKAVSVITEAGTYNVKVTGIGSYTGTVTKKLEVISADKKLIGKNYTDVTFVSEGDYTYTGKGIKPEVKVTDKTLDDLELKKGVDYTISYADNTKAGIARYTITGKGKYKGTYTGTFKIVPVKVGNLTQDEENGLIEAQGTTISLNKYQFSYSGKARKPTVTVKYNNKKLKEKTDYTLTYTAVNVQENAIEKKNADTYQVNITFKGNYEGTAMLSYRINPVDVSKLKITVPTQQYNGDAICPALSDMTVKLGSVKLDANALAGVVTGEWTNNIQVSKGKNKAGFTVTASAEAANFIGDTSKNVTFTIAQRSIANKNLTYTIGGYEVSGSSSKLELIYNNGVAFNQSNGAEIAILDAVTGNMLKEGVDYTLKYSNNKKVGTASVKISGIGGYKSSKTVKFKIVGKPIGNGQAYDDYKLVVGDSEADSYIYSGKAISPKVQLYEGSTLLRKNTDYTVKYTNNVNAGTATITVSGKGNYAGTISQSFTISPKGKEDAKTIKVSNISNQKYTGKVIVPSITVKVDGTTLKKGKDYTISVLNSTRLTYEDEDGRKGIATVMITGVGNYKGVLAKKSFIVEE